MTKKYMTAVQMATTLKTFNTSRQVVPSIDARRILGAKTSSMSRSHTTAATMSSNRTIMMALRKASSGKGSSCSHLFSYAQKRKKEEKKGEKTP